MSIVGKNLSPWEEMKQRVLSGIRQSPLFLGSCAGDIRYIQSLVLGGWSFVDNFPKVLISTFLCIELPEWMLVILSPILGGNSPREIKQRIVDEFRKVGREEKTHRDLWITWAATVGISEYDMKSSPVIPSVQSLLTKIQEERELCRWAALFGAVEVVAWAMGTALLESSRFEKVVGKGGLGWCQAHVHHDEGMSHEEFALKLAQISWIGENFHDKEIVCVAENFANLFIRAGVDCCALAKNRGDEPCAV